MHKLLGSSITLQLNKSCALCIGLFIGIVAARNGIASDGVLERLMVETRAMHPALHAQQAMARAAESGMESARWQFYPTPSLSVESAASSSGDPSYQGDAQVVLLGLRQPIWTAGRLTAGVEKAKATLSKTQASQDEVLQQLMLRVVQAFGDWLTASEKVKAYKSGYEEHLHLKVLVARRVQEGQSAQSDLALAESRLAALESDITIAQTQEVVAASRLSQLVGRALGSDELGSVPSHPPDIPEAMDQLLRDAQSASPTLRRHRALADELKAQMAALRADYWPEVYARLERQHGSFNVRDSDPENRFFIGFSSRFGAGLSNQSAIAEAASQHEAAMLEIEAQKRVLQEQIMVDHALLASVGQREKVLRNARASAREVMHSWDRQFLAGRKSWQDLMNALKEQVQLDVQFADLSAARLVSTWRIKLLTGEPVLDRQEVAPGNG